MLSGPALAQDDDDEDTNTGGWTTVGSQASGEELSDSSAWAALERLPPRYSSEFALSVSFSDITYWKNEETYGGPFLGQGVRFAWGRNFKDSRVGFLVSAAVEGPVPIYYTVAFEPMASWDYIRNWLQVGASVGPAIMIHQMGGVGTFPGLGPSVSVRMGWSQSWTRVGRRVFVLLEPKARLVAGEPNLGAAILVGQGRGR